MYKIELEQFQGPLDLLLQLIEQRQLDISQVSLAEVTDQYLAYIEGNENISPMELADFLVVATKLLITKSRILLPQMDYEEEDSVEELEQQLKIYKDYLEASKVIEKIIAQKNFSFSREKLAVQRDITFSPPKKIVKNDLKDAFYNILERIDYIVNLPQKVMTKTVTLKEMVSRIKSNLSKMSKMNFSHVLREVGSRTDVVVCFVALLELIKSGEVAVTQKTVFDEINIEKAKSV